MLRRTILWTLALSASLLPPASLRAQSAPVTDGGQTTLPTALPPDNPQQQVAPPPTQAPAPIVRPAQPVPTETLPAQQPDASQQPMAAPSEPQATAPVEEPVREKGPKQDNDKPVPASEIHNPSLWHDPGNIASLNLYWGQGGEKHMPKPPFTFEAEDKNGTNPKFDARDADGKKWRVKTGEEARPEVVASRLLWAMGYYVNDDYVLQSAEVSGVHMSRGDKETKEGHIVEARFERKPGGEKKIGIWEWKQNPFSGTKEFNGLRVMMAVMNNWDLKDVNNSVYSVEGSDKQLFLCNDIGASFGTNGLSWTRARSKGNINSFKGSKFITHMSDAEVDFATPKRPTGLLIATAGATAKEFSMRSGLDWIGNNIPRQDARWMGHMLGQLSHQQLVDAFRAGHFPPDQIDAYVEVVESRINELKAL